MNRTPYELAATMEHFPCKTAAGLELFKILSGPTVSIKLQQQIGRYMFKWGYFKEDELAEGAKIVAQWPRSRWSRCDLPVDGLCSTIVMHHKHILLELAAIVHKAKVSLQYDRYTVHADTYTILG